MSFHLAHPRFGHFYRRLLLPLFVLLPLFYALPAWVHSGAMQWVDHSLQILRTSVPAHAGTLSSTLVRYSASLTGTNWLYTYVLNESFCEVVYTRYMQVVQAMETGHQTLNRGEYHFGYSTGLFCVLGYLLLAILYYVRFKCLKLLLSYHSWLHRPKHFSTKVWGLLVKGLSGRCPNIFDLEPALPHLPVPPLSQTMNNWLFSVKPLLTDEEFKHTQGLVSDFKQSIGWKLHLFVWLRSLVKANWLTDWWVNYVYLRSRKPLVINSNFYMNGNVYWTEKDPATRTAALVGGFVDVFLKIRECKLKTLRIMDTVPVCMDGYRRVYGTTRVPGKEQDELILNPNSKHIAVFAYGQVYKLRVMSEQGKPVHSAALKVHFEQILKEAKASESKFPVGVLTAQDRTAWAEVREANFSSGVNKTSLDVIETALFVVCFDIEQKVTNATEESKLLLHGDCRNRWFDKSFQVIVASDAYTGLNVEHSYADAPVPAHVWEEILTDEPEYLTELYKAGTPSGNALGEGPELLHFDMTDPLKEAISNALKRSRVETNDLDLKVQKFTEFGKSFPKSVGISPDGFLQMALQLAYLRDQGEPGLAYESCSTRFFLHGRTETIRPVTDVSVEWARAMDDAKIDSQTRIGLLKKSIKFQGESMKQAMKGQGVDRHLFGMYVACLGLKYDLHPLFKDKSFQFNYKLSTSQTPTRQTAKYEVTEEKHSPGGGFGPVDPSGYGISYLIVGENMLYFHVSSRRGCGMTSSPRMAERICTAMRDIQSLFAQKEIKA